MTTIRIGPSPFVMWLGLTATNSKQGQTIQSRPAADTGGDVSAWHVRSREINEVVQASDQWEAWDTLRDRSAFDFGLVAVAEPDESGDPIPVQTATLMRRWGRDEDAEAFDAVAREHGLLPASSVAGTPGPAADTGDDET